jgi:pyruvate dehydrogenase E2 component (dihydrolipoamide acetyltransferase)
MATVVRMPSVIANATEGAIQTWLAAEGQTVSIGDPLVEIETEKAVVEYAAEVYGTVGKLLARAGESLTVGTPIAVILAAGEGLDQVSAALEAAGVGVGDDATAAPVREPTGGRLFASPIVRRLARERRIDLESLKGTGPGGRIVRRDIDGSGAAVRTATPPKVADVTATQTTVPTVVAVINGAAYTDIPLTGMRRAIARRLTESKTTVPHFYLTAHPNVSRLLRLRQEINSSAPRKISVNDFVIKAVAAALVEVPAANAIWGIDHIRQFNGVDIAVAVAVEGGLLTPVLRGVDSASLSQVSATVAGFADRARAGRITQDELEGGSFSISNLGMYGVDEFSAILNPPQAGILAVSAAKLRPIVGDDGEIAVANVMTVTLSADHRVIDGTVAAEWMSAFTRCIENPLTILI